jgi:hypothetical protein
MAKRLWNPLECPLRFAPIARSLALRIPCTLFNAARRPLPRLRAALCTETLSISEIIDPDYQDYVSPKLAESQRVLSSGLTEIV